MDIFEYIKNNFSVDEPIFIDDIQSIFPERSRPWIDKAIRELVEKKAIKRYSTGIYYIPRKTLFGDSILSPEKIISKRYISNKDNVYGYISGISLLNSVGLTTQVPNIITIVTNQESSRGRKIYVGNQCVYISRPNAPINSANSATLKFLEIIKTVNPDKLDKIEQSNLKKYIDENNITLYKVSKYCEYFPDYVSKRILGGRVFELLTQ